MTKPDTRLNTNGIASATSESSRHSTAELIACPFCGTKPHPVVTYDTCADKDTFCDNDDCPIQGVVMSVDRWQNQPKADRLAEQELVVQELSMLIRMLCSYKDVNGEIKEKAKDYLSRKNLTGSILRNPYDKLSIHADKREKALQHTTEEN